ncbi:MAG: Ldh family oxidoreductase [Bacteroidales bacterium]
MYREDTLTKLTTNLLARCGVNDADAKVTASVLVAAEMRNIPSHGLLRLPDYIRMLRSGRINPAGNPVITHQSLSTVTLNGDNSLGPVAASRAMALALEKADKAGTGWVAVENSNHFGIAGYYAMQALEHDMIGICMTNANPLVAPTFSAEGLLGTNPLAVAIPAGNEPPLVADFATAAIARGKADMLVKQGKPIEKGFVQDKNGQLSTDPSVLARGGAILPLGSTRQFGSHKGYCMAAVADILSAVLSGANYGPFVPPSVAWLPVKENLPGRGTGHFIGAMRTDAFRPAKEFKSHMDNWIRTFRNGRPSAGQEKVLIPGDPERMAEAVNTKTGVPLLEKVEEELKQWCRDLDVEYPAKDN